MSFFLKEIEVFETVQNNCSNNGWNQSAGTSKWFGSTDHQDQSWSLFLTSKHLLLWAITISFDMSVTGVHLTRNTFITLKVFILPLRKIRSSVSGFWICIFQLIYGFTTFYSRSKIHLQHIYQFPSVSSGLQKMPQTLDLLF